MKRTKFLFLAAIILAVGGAIGYHSYQKNQEPKLSKLAIANIEALTEEESGNSGANANCPNGGYPSTGNRKENTKSFWCKIDLNANAVVDMDTKKGSAQAGFKWELLPTTAYNCDGKNNNYCLVCNRYVLK